VASLRDARRDSLTRDCRRTDQSRRVHTEYRTRRTRTPPPR